MDFTKFPKVQGLIKTYQAGYVPYGDYIVTVKMDGANAGIIREGSTLKVHSRNTFLGVVSSSTQDTSGWNKLEGFVDFVVKRYDHFISKLLDGEHVYGEWLVPHTITYPNIMYKKFYVFDSQFDHILSDTLGIVKVPYVDQFTIHGHEDPHELYKTLTNLVQPYVDTTRLLHKTEGIVLKNRDINERFKIVFDEFKEDNRIKFNSKTFDTTKNVEVGVASMYPVRAYEKTLEKVKTLKSLEHLSKKEIPAVLGLAWHDYFTEFLSDAIVKTHYPTINFKVLKTEFENRIRTVYITQLDTGVYPVWFTD